jgi:phospholipid/cholesterol/gamma-HCH transport system substrate-binding protein
MLFGSALLAGGVLVLAGMRIWEKKDTYTVRYNEEVSGLELSSAVRYQGLRVGTVADMYISPEDATAIDVVLSLDPRTVLYEGTKAELAQGLLTGLKHIALVPGDPKKPRIPPGSYIEAGESLMGRLTGQAEQIAVKVEYVANQLSTWTSAENRERFERMVESFTALANEIDAFLETNREPFKGALGGVEKAGTAVAQLTGEGDRSLKAITAEVQSTLAEARNTLKELRRPTSKIDPDELAGTVTATRKAMTSLDARLSSKELGQSLTNLSKALADLIQLIEATDLTVRAGREDFVAALQDLRQAAEHVREFSRIIAQDPSAVIRGKD